MTQELEAKKEKDRNIGQVSNAQEIKADVDDEHTGRPPTTLPDLMVPAFIGSIGLVYALTTAQPYSQPIILIGSVLLLALTAKKMYNYVKRV